MNCLVCELFSVGTGAPVGSAGLGPGDDVGLTFPDDEPFELSNSAERAQEKLAGSGRITGGGLTFLKELNPELRKR